MRQGKQLSAGSSRCLQRAVEMERPGQAVPDPRGWWALQEARGGSAWGVPLRTREGPLSRLGAICVAGWHLHTSFV